MESLSSSALSSYFRHGTVTVAPLIINTTPSSTTKATPPTTMASLSASSAASSSISSTQSSVSRPVTSVAIQSLPSSAFASSTSGGLPSFTLNNGFGNPSAPAASLDETDAQPYNPSSLVVVLSILGVLTASVVIWLIFRYISRRRSALQGDDDLDHRHRPNQEGWAKRLTFTGNREKFWQRLDDYHESLRAREEGRVKRSMAGVSMGQVPRFSTVPPGLDIHPSFQPAPTGVAKNDNGSVKSFMIGSDDELAYLHTMFKDGHPQTPAHSRPPPSAPMSVKSSITGSFRADIDTGPHGHSTSTSRAPPAQPSKPGHKRVESLAKSTPLPDSTSEDSIDCVDRIDTTGTQKSRVVETKSIPVSQQQPHQPPTPSTNSFVSEPDLLYLHSFTDIPQGAEKALSRPTQQHLSAISNYSIPSTSHLTPDFIPLSQMAHLKNQPDYRSPTESIYGCYKTDEERHASFISSTSAGGGSVSATLAVPAVPPIPASYRK